MTEPKRPLLVEVDETLYQHMIATSQPLLFDTLVKFIEQ